MDAPVDTVRVAFTRSFRVNLRPTQRFGANRRHTFAIFRGVLYRGSKRIGWVIGGAMSRFEQSVGSRARVIVISCLDSNRPPLRVFESQLARGARRASFARSFRANSRATRGIRLAESPLCERRCPYRPLFAVVWNARATRARRVRFRPVVVISRVFQILSARSRESTSSTTRSTRRRDLESTDGGATGWRGWSRQRRITSSLARHGLVSKFIYYACPSNYVFICKDLSLCGIWRRDRNLTGA